MSPDRPERVKRAFCSTNPFRKNGCDVFQSRMVPSYVNAAGANVVGSRMRALIASPITDGSRSCATALHGKNKRETIKQLPSTRNCRAIGYLRRSALQDVDPTLTAVPVDKWRRKWLYDSVSGSRSIFGVEDMISAAGRPRRAWRRCNRRLRWPG